MQSTVKLSIRPDTLSFVARDLKGSYPRVQSGLSLLLEQGWRGTPLPHSYVAWVQHTASEIVFHPLQYSFPKQADLVFTRLGSLFAPFFKSYDFLVCSLYYRVIYLAWRLTRRNDFVGRTVTKLWSAVNICSQRR